MREELASVQAKLSDSEVEMQHLRTDAQGSQTAQEQLTQESERSQYLEQELQSTRNKVHSRPPRFVGD